MDRSETTAEHGRTGHELGGIPGLHMPADTVHHESFFSCIVVLLVFEPEANEHERAEAYTFPTDEHHDVV